MILAVVTQTRYLNTPEKMKFDDLKKSVHASEASMKLPSERTLQLLLKPGFQPEVLGQLLKEANLEALPSRRFVTVILDEMKIKEGLIYSK